MLKRQASGDSVWGGQVQKVAEQAQRQLGHVELDAATLGCDAASLVSVVAGEITGVFVY